MRRGGFGSLLGTHSRGHPLVLQQGGFIQGTDPDFEMLTAVALWLWAGSG